MEHIIKIYHSQVVENAGKEKVIRVKLVLTFEFELKVLQSSRTAFMRRNYKFHPIKVQRLLPETYDIQEINLDIQKMINLGIFTNVEM